MKVSVTVNGKVKEVEVEGRTLLADMLRDTLALTGTKVGCDTGTCGACVVMVDGVSVKSCMMLAAQAEGSHITTIEGISKSGQMHPLQASFQELHGLQCGFCTPGMVMSLLDLLAQQPRPSEAETRTWLEGNLCRCTGYHNVIKTVQAVVQQGQAQEAEPAPVTA